MNARVDRIEHSLELASALPRRLTTPSLDAHDGDDADEEIDYQATASAADRFRSNIWVLREHSAGRSQLPDSLARLPILGSGPGQRLILRIYNFASRPSRFRSGVLADSMEILAEELLGKDHRR